MTACTSCIVDGVRGRGRDAGMRAVAEAVRLLSEGTRESTKKNHARGIGDFVRWSERALGRVALPATEMEIVLYMTFCVRARVPVLDGSTLVNYVGGVSAWHEVARDSLLERGLLVNPVKTRQVRRLSKIVQKDYKLESKAMRPLTLAETRGVLERGFAPSRSGEQKCLVFVLCMMAPLRPKAASAIVVRFEVKGKRVVYHDDSDVWVVRGDPQWREPYMMIKVNLDKNVTSARRRTVPIPATMMGVRPVQLLEHYLVHGGVQSGAFLLSAPLGKTGWRINKYTAHSSMVKAGLKRAFPGRPCVRIGGASPRKTMAQLLWRAGYSRRVLSDIGGWKFRQAAQDVYYTTEFDVVLRIKETLFDDLLAIGK